DGKEDGLRLGLLRIMRILTNRRFLSLRRLLKVIQITLLQRFLAD
ncbi:hypothetical protein HMPREF1575_01312, partial [Gardnerella vaginalis JCP7672]